ncbi:GNAT family N-acetyltransferase [Streptomyces sp. NBC_01187]|uniref:GNAT family N-acetyltransferase n=1 Tax=Streptomyces sp. NBC_01187 TaxID=2903766 RepID=UPI00386BDDA9|nr:mycothiol acetyltransferase [Streptomyces sp. NBC_01187]
MTTIRTAHPEELPALVQLQGGAGERDSGTRAYLSELLERRCTRPEWCLVASEDGAGPVGSAVLWALPGHEVPEAVVLLEAPWGESELMVGRRLLEEAAALARGAGAEELLHVVDGPPQAPQFQERPERRTELLGSCGFARVRDGRRFRLPAGSALPTEDPRLVFRDFTELGGREPFVGLLAELLGDTADAWLAADVERLGAKGAAEELFDDAAALEHRPEWFEIGYTLDGEPAVVSLPALSPSAPVIGFVGVAPAHRGHGYATAAVARGTHVLARGTAGSEGSEGPDESGGTAGLAGAGRDRDGDGDGGLLGVGAVEIRGDCDAGNVAMIKGFENCGYERFASREEYVLRL